jgi:pimeloyl-ACP methyl ester carboxylesterase
MADSRGGALAPTPLQITTTDGLKLSALHYGPLDAGIAVAFAHGFTGSQRNPKVVRLAQHAADAGIAFITADLRGHGTSDGYSTLGDREINDIDAVVTAARRGHARVVSVGASMGGFIALRHAALCGGVDAVISISSPAAADTPKLPRARVLVRMARSKQGRRLLQQRGTRVADAAPITIPHVDLSRISVPVAIVHGRRDRYVPLFDAYALYERLTEPRRIVVLPNFGHGEAAFDDVFASQLLDLVIDLAGRRAR